MTLITEAAILEALRLQSKGAWRSLDQLRQQTTGSDLSLPNALLCALCASPLQPADTCKESLMALAQLSPRSACAIALSRTFLALGQQHLLSGRIDSSCALFRQALARSMNAVEAVGMSIPVLLHDEVLDQAGGLQKTLASQLNLALASQRDHLPGQLVLVLGMHRSGTSALSGLLVQAGLDAPQDLMPPTEANPKGYWESLGAMELNDNMLRQLGSEWNSSSTQHSKGWGLHEPAANEWRAGLLSLLHSSYPAGGSALLKDPRLCVLLPGLRPWLESGLMTCTVFLPIRHPAEVAASLNVAEGTIRGQALLLWLGHVFQAEKHSRGLDRLIVNYQQMLTDPDMVLELCRKTIEQSCGSRGLETSWKADATSFIEPKLHRQRADGSVPTWVLDEGAERWFELAMRVHSVMVDLKCSEDERAADMDQLWRQWTALAP
jgi:hypothetical protein